MTNPEQPSTPSGSSETSTTKATDHELQEYDIFTRYGHTATLPRHASRPVSFQAAENSPWKIGPGILARRATRTVDPNTGICCSALAPAALLGCAVRACGSAVHASNLGSETTRIPAKQ